MSEDRPAVSVIIPTHNRLPLLEEAVGSVLGQQGPDFEVIVVDDASDDGTSEWAQAVADPRLRYARLPRHSERSVARNEGLDLARGRSLLYLDDDDRLRPGALSVLWDALETNPSSAAAVGGLIWFDATGATRRAWQPRRVVVLDRPWAEVLFGWWPLTGQTLMRADASRSAGRWDPSCVLSEDVDMILRLANVGAFVVVPSWVLDYRVHLGQVPRPDDIDDHNLGILERFVGDLAPADRALARRVLLARDRARAGNRAYDDAHTAAALARYTASALGWPALVTSPPLRHMLLEPAIRCVLGGRMLRLGQRAQATLTRRPGETGHVAS